MGALSLARIYQGLLTRNTDCMSLYGFVSNYMTFLCTGSGVQPSHKYLFPVVWQVKVIV